MEREPSPPRAASTSATRPRICFVSNGAYPLLADRMNSPRVGGAELQQVLLGEELVRRGYAVSFVTPDHGPGPDARLGVFRVLGSWRPDAGLPGVRFVYPRLVELWRALARADADIYCVRTACKELATVVGFARRQRRLAVFCGASDSDLAPDQLRLRAFPDRAMYLWGLRGCHGIVAQSERQRSAVREHLGRASVVIPNGYAGSGRLVSNGDRILWVATFRNCKRPHLVLEVAARLPELKFTMVGGPSWSKLDDPDLFARVKAEAAKRSNVEVCGALPLRETEARFDRAAVFVNTSYDEGFPNTFLQAWSRGVPVVSFFDPDGVIGRHRLGVAVEDTEAMVRALRDLSERRVRFAPEAIQEYFEAHFTLEALGDRYAQFFASLQRKP